MLWQWKFSFQLKFKDSTARKNLFYGIDNSTYSFLCDMKNNMH